MRARVCARMCVCARARVRVRACVCVYVCVCVLECVCGNESHLAGPCVHSFPYVCLFRLLAPIGVCVFVMHDGVAAIFTTSKNTTAVFLAKV